MNIRKVTNLELTLYEMRMVICLQTPTILNRQKNYFCQLLNVNGSNDVRQKGILLSH
jgi:hypothetical protein